MSGSDRIFIELIKRWKNRLKPILIVSSDGWKICEREDLQDNDHVIWAKASRLKGGYFVNYIYRTLLGITNSLRLKIADKDLIYSSSDFWPDSLPAFFLKLRFKKAKWIAGFYLFAPSPFSAASPYKGNRFLLGLFYYITQKPVYFIIKRFADLVFVTSNPDVSLFVTKNRPYEKVVVVKGGVDTSAALKYAQENNPVPYQSRKYDACFVGRFHYQKGVIELIKIWNKVSLKNKNAKLALIGDGPLENEISETIKKLDLNSNIDILGFLDGEKKFEIFKNSKIIVHPAVYDSGGMAAMEGFAWGLPGVSFDLDALKSYYPKGMIKTDCFNLDLFAENILKLINDEGLYSRMSFEAFELARSWDWDKRAEEIYFSIEKHI